MRSTFMTRMAFGTVAAAGILGALATAEEAADQVTAPVAVAVAVPMQPPVPPGPPVPPPMQEPGQEGPGSSQYDQPPPPAPAPPNENAICQDIMGVPLPPGCHDPRNDV
ncbi:hypothetical protein [Pseudonocardia endophytica]|uniref:hypothetical protein n=1 Tax=Pseudonocardia endophytica TaxID=401976 RepID=UPI001053F290|nr:hypothetical protein [Pseudonocardia endophytica]